MKEDVHTYSPSGPVFRLLKPVDIFITCNDALKPFSPVVPLKTRERPRHGNQQWDFVRAFHGVDEGFKEMWVPAAACAQSSGTLCCFGCAMQCYLYHELIQQFHCNKNVQMSLRALTCSVEAQKGSEKFGVCRAWAWGSLHGTPLHRESILPAKRESAAVQPSSILRACITQHLTSLPPNPNLPTARPDLPLSTAQSTSSSSSPSFAGHSFCRTWPGFLFGSCKLSSSRGRLGRIGGREFSTAPSLWGWRYRFSLLRTINLPWKAVHSTPPFCLSPSSDIASSSAFPSLWEMLMWAAGFMVQNHEPRHQVSKAGLQSASQPAIAAR
ncbi:uncharacterized protein B0T23DRAFT_391977 [Neurospora hispaniola]|uniref:Uncharacterized protein n=1 Tax=Neurospora hispaniola TaxID=588809 RepID=A0AAJ0IFE9_9PEZI|nr:hypothetical protein B0T23DRAFT_391977 [Neurospora hispaniola]